MGVSRLETVLSQYPVWTQTSNALSHRDLMSLSLTCKSINGLALSTLYEKQNVDNRFRAFVKDTTSFRLMLRDTGAVVAGEFARQFFVGRQTPSRMQIVVVDPRFYSGGKTNRWVRYLRRREGYSSFSINHALWLRGSQVSASGVLGPRLIAAGYPVLQRVRSSD